MDSFSDHDLIRDCLAGRTEAFDGLVLRYQDRLYHALTHLAGSAEDALDVSQEAFVQAFRRLSTFRGDAAFYTWLFRIALNLYRSRNRIRRPGCVSIDLMKLRNGSEPADGGTDAAPAHRMETAERRALVREAIAGLPDELRAVLVLRELEGHGYEQIAELLGCPIGTVRSRIHRARMELRERLPHLLGECP